ncbi:MAG: DUF262 domain-containing protein [Planctomycetaceae bacterium]|nr:DUF262 domain-containing protein [Planctomycetaceae bacterium]
MSDELQLQIDEKRKQIHSDQYPMSIGELANLYKDGDIDIHPEFQRFYRWSDEQKSRFVESILLGIPIPSLFVAQRQDGKWDLIDGLQRLSTLFQLMGLLKGTEGASEPPLVLTSTKYLPALADKVWTATSTYPTCLSPTQQLLIKRAKLDVKIILRESDESAKFELFQRLNTGGSDLTDQEIRNAMLVAVNPNFFRWLQDLADSDDFRNCVLLSERQFDERYDLELVLRFLLLRKLTIRQLRQIGDLGEFLTDEMMKYLEGFEERREEDEFAFRQTFSILASELAENAFRKYDSSKRKFVGGFLISGYECVALGIAYHVELNEEWRPENLKQKIKSMWASSVFTTSTGSGVRASTRIPQTVNKGRETFAR